MAFPFFLTSTSPRLLHSSRPRPRRCTPFAPWAAVPSRNCSPLSLRGTSQRQIRHRSTWGTLGRTIDHDPADFLACELSRPSARATTEIPRLGTLSHLLARTRTPLSQTRPASQPASQPTHATLRYPQLSISAIPTATALGRPGLAKLLAPRLRRLRHLPLWTQAPTDRYQPTRRTCCLAPLGLGGLTKLLVLLLLLRAHPACWSHQSRD